MTLPQWIADARKLCEPARNRLEEIMGPPLLVCSELRGGDLVTIYPHCKRDELARFCKNHSIPEAQISKLAGEKV